MSAIIRLTIMSALFVCIIVSCSTEKKSDSEESVDLTGKSVNEDNSEDSKNSAANFESVKIGNQVWMTRNLDVTNYRNGDPIPGVVDAQEWENLTIGAWCYLQDDPDYDTVFGKLYNWHAVNDPRGLAPEGWHIPTDDEWKELEMFLGMNKSHVEGQNWRGNDEGAKLAGRADLWLGSNEKENCYWRHFMMDECYLDANQNFGSSGFGGLPGGYKPMGQYHEYSLSEFVYDTSSNENHPTMAIWWTATEYLVDSTKAWSRSISSYQSQIYRTPENKNDGYSVRCIKD